MKLRLAAVLAPILLSGCASVMEGSDQGININTTGCEDSGVIICSVRNSKMPKITAASVSSKAQEAP